jgi:hypothetical protein
VQTVKGVGFSFTAPVDWTVARTGTSASASLGAVDFVQVRLFRLEKPYRIAQFGAVSHELDTVAAGLAKQISGDVVSRSTMQVSGRKTRYYELAFDHGKTEEIAFVLAGQSEYQVLCRRVASAPDATCAQLFSSFTLS